MSQQIVVVTRFRLSWLGGWDKELSRNRGADTFAAARLHAATRWQADVLGVKSLTTRGIRDLFLIFGQKHLDYLKRVFTTSYHTRRPRQGKDNQILLFPPKPVPGKRKSTVALPTPTPTVSPADVKCEPQVGGLLKHDHRRAA